MIKRFASYLSPRAAAKPAPAALPAGQRVYAIGDIHGRLDLFEDMIGQIERDDLRRGAGSDGACETTVILLGDLVDRGPDSAGVIQTARAWARVRPLRLLVGNHEEMFLRSFTQLDVLRHFLRFGGKDTLLSYPLDRATYQDLTLEALQALLPAIVPPADIAWLESAEDAIRMGDYLFVHAGIRPGVPLDEQKSSDLRWIRESFIDHTGDHGVVVVHGHTITDTVEELPNRIGIDTGAFMSGRLTALGLEGTQRWYLEACDAIARADEITGRDAA